MAVAAVPAEAPESDATADMFRYRVVAPHNDRSGIFLASRICSGESGQRVCQAELGVVWRLTRTATKNAIADSIETRKTVHSTAT